MERNHHQQHITKGQVDGKKKRNYAWERKVDFHQIYRCHFLCLLISSLLLSCYFIYWKGEKSNKRAEKNYNKNIIKRRKRDEDRRICSKKRFDDKDEMNANVVNDMIRSHKDHSIKKNIR
jgi:hypothetical protein